ncbi:MAG: hypothetical protein PVH65_02820 [Chloroflexota bacterium]
MSGTIIPWLVGGLLLLTVLTLTVTIKSWHAAKRSPYFFLRVQAARRMQRYLVATLVLLLITLGTSAYAWQTPQASAPQHARLSYAKPTQSAAVVNEDESLAQASPTTVEIDLSPVMNRVAATAPGLSDPLLKPALPDEYNQLEPEVELQPDTAIGEISFSTEISSDFQALEAGRRFGKGFFTLYATFAYDGLADGMTWSWVWRHNNQVVDGGNQVWSYGKDGPGYVYFQPDEGFQLGDYSLEIWVNDALMAQSNFTVIDSVSATN